MEDVTKVVKNVMNNIGLEVQKPKGKCEDEKCPWHGHLKVRGRMFRGTVVAAKVPLTAVVEWNYYNYMHKYERYERRKSSLAAQNPECIAAKAGDVVHIAECRPLSKTKKFVIIEKLGGSE